MCNNNKRTKNKNKNKNSYSNIDNINTIYFHKYKLLGTINLEDYLV